MFLKKKLVFVLVPLLLALAVPAASLADTGTQTTAPATAQNKISLGDAIKMADNSNVTLLQDQVAAKMANNSSSNAGFQNTVTTSFALQNADFTLADEKNTVIVTTETNYFAVQDAVYNEQVTALAVQVAQEAYEMAQAQESAGTETQADVTQAKSNLDQARSGLTQAKTAVNTAYVTFDNAVGLDPGALPDLTSVAAYDPNYQSGLSDVQQAVAATLKNNPNVQIARNGYNEAIDTEAFQRPVQNGTLYVQDAGLAYKLALQKLTDLATSDYLTVGYDLDAYNAATKAVSYAQVTCSNDQASYKAGVVTKYQLNSDEESLLSANQTLEADLHKLLEDRASLAQVTGVGSVTVPVKNQ